MQRVDAIRHVQRRAFVALGQEVAHGAIHRARQPHGDSLGGHKGERSIDGADGGRVAGEHAAARLFHVHVRDLIQRRVEEIDHTADRMTHGRIVGYLPGGIKKPDSAFWPIMVRHRSPASRAPFWQIAARPGRWIGSRASGTLHGLRGLVGSTVHGLNVNDGIEDRDEMEICVEPLEEAMALGSPFEQFIYCSAAERKGRDDARSTAGDSSTSPFTASENGCVWRSKGIRRSSSCCSRLMTNWFTADSVGFGVTRVDAGDHLAAGTRTIPRLSAGAEAAFDRRARPEADSSAGARKMYGFDTKYTMHMLRLGFQGVELLTTGHLSLPMREPARSYLLDVRREGSPSRSAYASRRARTRTHGSPHHEPFT